MARVLVMYGTTEAQTSKMSEYAAGVARDHGHEAEALDITGLPGGFSLAGRDAVVVGA
jgi:menaquinone-dependent protoporphyrinogen oxidase